MTIRPERVPAEEVRQRMLDAGRELALEAGAALTIEQLRVEEVIQRARVPRSSAYRLWPYKEDYIDDLLCYLAGAGSWFSDRPVLDPETFTVVKQILAANRHLLRTMAGRRAVLCEVVRVAATRNYEALTESAPWRLHMALIATLGSTRTERSRRRIAIALEDAQRRSRESIVAVLGYMSRELGLRPRDPAYTFDHVQLTAGLLVQSLSLRNVQVRAALGDGAPEDARADGTADDTAADRADGKADDAADNRADDGPGDARDDRATGGSAEAQLVNELLNVPLPGPSLTGEPAQWSLIALAYLGVLDSFIELDPDFVPPVD